LQPLCSEFVSPARCWLRTGPASVASFKTSFSSSSLQTNETVLEAARNEMGVTGKTMTNAMTLRGRVVTRSMNGATATDMVGRMIFETIGNTIGLTAGTRGGMIANHKHVHHGRIGALVQSTDPGRDGPKSQESIQNRGVLVGSG